MLLSGKVCPQFLANIHDAQYQGLPSVCLDDIDVVHCHPFLADVRAVQCQGLPLAFLANIHAFLCQDSSSVSGVLAFCQGLSSVPV